MLTCRQLYLGRHPYTESPRRPTACSSLRHNLRSCSEDTKVNAYFSMVRSNLEYCSSVWNPHQKDQIRKLETIQRRAARYTTNQYRNTNRAFSMLDHLQWESLESRRSKIQMTLLYKIVNDMIDIPADEYLTKGASRTRSAHSKKYRQYHTSTDSLKYSFPPHHTFVEFSSSIHC